jgi:hypothetical protein
VNRSPRRPGAFGAGWYRLIVAAVLGVSTLVLAAAAMAAPDCQMQVDRRDGEAFRDPATAYRVTDLRRELLLTGTVPAGTASVRIELEFSPVRWLVRELPTARGGAWSATVAPAEYEKGVGLYHVRASTDTSCAVDAWVRVEGSPFGTLAGKAAGITLALGLLLQLLGLMRSSWWSVAGGVPTGVGIAVLLQQFGILPLEGFSLVVFPAISSGVGAVTRAFVSFQPRFKKVGRSLPQAGNGGRAVPRTAEPDLEPRGLPTTRAQPPGPSASTAHARPSAPGASASRARPSAPGATARETATPPGATRPAKPQTKSGELPERSFARLACDSAVVAGTPFELEVGLAAEPTPGVEFGVVKRPEGVTGAYELMIHVVADGFKIQEGETWRRTVSVTVELPYPKFTLHLTAEQQALDVVERRIDAYFAVKGEPVGLAQRPIRVVRTPEAAAAGGGEPPAVVVAMGVPTGLAITDLTVQIIAGKEEKDGRFRWIMDTPHPVDLPDDPLEIDLGQTPESFSRYIAKKMGSKDGELDLYPFAAGVGKEVADQIPIEFWRVLLDVYESIGKHPPTVLICTEEPYVPWELALMEPPLDPKAPPFLGAQAVVGRWVPGKATATKPGVPPVRPPATLHVSVIAVVSGKYDKNPLPEAEREAYELAKAYGAVAVNAASVDVLRCVEEGQPQAELLHFALHGRYEPFGDRDGLVLVDGKMLEPLVVQGCTLQWAPLVFLNACQVGAGNLVLGDYAGMARAFLRAGASAVIAPIWSVQDDIAREIALRFYERLFNGSSPAEALRLERVRFTHDPSPTTATFLAYQYFGHPAMKITR